MKSPTDSHRLSVIVGLGLLVVLPAAAQAPVDDLSVARPPVTSTVAAATANMDLAERVALIERLLENRTDMQHRMQQQIDYLQSDIDELKGAIEVHTHQIETILERQRELYLEIDKRVDALKQQSPVANTAVTSAGNAQPLVDEATQYENAVNLILKTKEYDRAIPAFEAFIAAYPNGEYTANAHYWLGQLLFNQQQWQAAKEQFETLVTQYTSSAKRPDALLKLGNIAQRENQTTVAGDFYRRVINEYPNSTARKLAEAQLNKL